MSTEKTQRKMVNKATLTESQFENGVSKEKILMQAEYLRRLNQPAYERVTTINSLFYIFDNNSLPIQGTGECTI